jgi:ADP-ribosylglycohydrolase
MEEQDRKRGAIWGQLIGDAYTLGSHWIYDPEKMRQQFPDGVKGFDTPKQGDYHYGKVSGDSTHYGEGCRLLLQSIAERKNFDPTDFIKRFRTFFSSPYYKGYIDHATRETLENLAKNIMPPGADDHQMATATRLAPLVVFFNKSSELLKKVEEATRIGQNNPKSVAYMLCNAKILVDLLNGMELRAAFEKQIDDPVAGPKIKAALQLKDVSFFEAANKFGLSCALDEAFPCAVYAALFTNGSFEQAIRINAQAGGDSAGRGGLLGAWLGAYQGISGIPQEWLMKLRGKEFVHYWVEELLTK